MARRDEAAFPVAGPARRVMDALGRPFSLFKRWLPRGLFPRSLIIIVMPVVLLQLIITLIFFERHYQLVTRRLSQSVAGDIATLISLYDASPTYATFNLLADTARRTMYFEISLDESAALPAQAPVGLFNPLDGIIARQLDAQISEPFWFDTTSISSHVDIRVDLGDEIMRVMVRRSRVLATNWHIFLVWMVISSAVLLAIGVLFLRNQIRPILRLAKAAEAFGRGREVRDFRPSGASEVRSAARALIDMRSRLARHIEQRTDMLAGISHDLRTPITRIRLQLALLEPTPDTEAIKGDLEEMEHMLEEYLAFARGEAAEGFEDVDVPALMGELVAEIEDASRPPGLVIEPSARERLAAVPLRRSAFKRCVRNLIENAVRYGHTARVTLRAAERFFEVAVEDDGPGISPDLYEEAFRPFRRLDAGLSSGAPGSGLGLAISRDLARSHGGDVYLSASTLGGLKAAVRLPL